jgi:hypothetical protein
MATRLYTGVGSRSTPQDVLRQMESVGRQLAASRLTLRSGGADGADMAFERGCDSRYGDKEIYLPWKYFNKNTSRLFVIPEVAFDIAATLHLRFQYLKAPVKKLHARNVLQVLGQDVATPTGVVICWTPNGAIVGGTATAIKLAIELDIPVVNMAKEGWLKELNDLGLNVGV